MRYRLDPDKVVWREVDREIVTVDLTSAEYLAANSTAGTLWPLLDRGATVDEMVDAIMAEYDAPDDVIRRDVTEFVDGLRARNLVVVDEG